MKSTTPYISKTAFIQGYQCIKSLYLAKNTNICNHKKRNDKRGLKTELLAKNIFPKGVNMYMLGDNALNRAKRTFEHIEKGEHILYEATFCSEGLQCACDILVNESKGVQVFEVKSTKKVHYHQILDVAFQLYVIRHSGIQVSDISLIHNDGKKMKTISVIKRAEALQPFIINKIHIFRDILYSASMPSVKMGAHCHKPYNCPFISFCSEKTHD